MMVGIVLPFAIRPIRVGNFSQVTIGIVLHLCRASDGIDNTGNPISRVVKGSQTSRIDHLGQFTCSQIVAILGLISLPIFQICQLIIGVKLIHCPIFECALEGAIAQLFEGGEVASGTGISPRRGWGCLK